MTRGLAPCALDVGADASMLHGDSMLFPARSFVERAFLGDDAKTGLEDAFLPSLLFYSVCMGLRQGSALHPPKGMIPFGILFCCRVFTALSFLTPRQGTLCSGSHLIRHGCAAPPSPRGEGFWLLFRNVWQDSSGDHRRAESGRSQRGSN